MGKQLDAFNNEAIEIEFLPSADTLEGNVFVKILPTRIHYQLMYNYTGMILCGNNILQAYTWEQVYADIVEQTQKRLIVQDSDKASCIFVTIKVTIIETILYAGKKWEHKSIEQKAIKFTKNVQDRDNT
jgi:hypothetical protein